MPSRLSSLLVRDGLVAVKGMERAFENQVLFGGALDTVLLELELVREDQLHKYLSLATGLPPARRDDVNGCSSEAAGTCSEELSTKYSVVPSALNDGALKVLVCEPADLASLEGLADEIGMAVQPLVVPEYRLRVAFHSLFGGDIDVRYTTLADRAAASPTPEVEAAVEQPVVVSHVAAAPVEVAPEVTEPQAPPEERLRGRRPDPEQPERRMTMEFSTEALREHVAATEALAADAPKIDAVEEAEPAVPTAEPAATPPAAEVVPPAQDAGDPLEEAGALSPAQAREVLVEPVSRDHIFHVLLRALRARTSYAALFTVQGQLAHGRTALLGDEVDRERIREIDVPLEKPSPFKQVVDTQSFFVGPWTEGNVGADDVVHRMANGQAPAALLVLPVVIRNRVVALAVGHSYDEEFNIGDVSELLPLAGATADAVSRLIMKSKAVGYRGADREQAQGQAVAVDQVKGAAPRTTAKGWSVAKDGDAAQAVDTAQAGDDSTSAGPPLADLFDAIERDDRSAKEEAMSAALARSEEVLEYLESCFPGRSTVERAETGGQSPRAEQCGAVLDLVIRLGAAAGELLAEKMRDNDRDVRYFAALCASQIRPSNALNQLVERLFDGDQKIRVLAVEGLRGYSAAELHEALEFARRALHSEDTERLKAAADGLAQVADVASIPDLLDVHSRGGGAADAARRALVSLTKHDFSGSNRKWRGWWNKNKEKNRIEWMLDGLSHKDADVRKSAVEDLRTVTGEYFGYHHDLPKKEREQSRQRWLKWWSESGRSRFVSTAGGRNKAPRGDAEARP